MPCSQLSPSLRPSAAFRKMLLSSRRRFVGPAASPYTDRASHTVWPLRCVSCVEDVLVYRLHNSALPSYDSLLFSRVKELFTRRRFQPADVADQHHYAVSPKTITTLRLTIGLQVGEVCWSTLIVTALSRGQREVCCETPFILFRRVCSTQRSSDMSLVLSYTEFCVT